MSIGYKHLKESRELEKEGRTKKEIADLLKRKYKLQQKQETIERRLRELNNRFLPEIDSLPDDYEDSPEQTVVPFKPTAILADIHAPLFNKDALQTAIMSTSSMGIKRVILLGDFLDNGWCSTFLDVAKKSGMFNVSEVIDSVYKTLSVIVNNYEEVFIVRGNHDERLAKALQKNLGMSEIYKIFSVQKGKPSLYEKLNIVENFQMYMTGSPTGDWLLAHQKNTSSIRGKVAQDLATIHEINVVTSHNHDLAVTTSRNKSRFFAVAAGCLADEAKMSYKTIRVSNYSPWITGWAYIDEEGIPHVCHYSRSIM
jgi:predicted phosphodiesterase